MGLTRPAAATAPSAALEWLIALAALVPAAVLIAMANGAWLPWIDEGQFVDPAARAHFGQGFTSTAWPFQTPNEFFAGNAPGYSLLLVPWFNLFGFGVVQARGLNWLLALVAAACLWSGVRRSVPDLSAWLRGVALGAAFMGSGISLSLWSARYDMLGLVAASALFMVSTWPHGRRRDVGLFVGGVGLFYAGFHLVVAAIIVLALLTLFGERRAFRFRRTAIATGLGLGAGLLSWLAVLAPHGLQYKFFLMLFGSQHTLSGQIAQLVLQGDTGFYKKFDAPRLLVEQDPSLTLIALVLAGLLVWRPGAEDPTAWRWLRFVALVFVLVLPVALTVIGKFPIYYTWIAYVPAVFLTAAASARWARAGRRGPMFVFVAAATVAAGLGTASRLGANQLAPGSAVYAHFDAWVRRGLPAGQWVYADFEAYFAARSVAGAVIVPTYGQTSIVKGIPERDRVDAAVVLADRAEAVATLLGGEWHTAARFDEHPALRYVLLRRGRAGGG